MGGFLEKFVIARTMRRKRPYSKALLMGSFFIRIPSTPSASFSVRWA
jgi:hypothetical protein